MKIFHTADWHLGKIIHGIHMTHDQEFVLDQLLTAIQDEKPDLLIIAGDIYDRAIPPTEAIALFDQFLTRVILELQTPVIAISGNHDSPARLNFGRQFMREQGFHIIGEYEDAFNPIIIADQHGDVYFHPIPYVEPATARLILADESIRTHDDAMKKTIEKITETLDPTARHVAIAHAFITHTSQDQLTSDSERPLAIGGSEFIYADHFTPFHYTALGHLHQAHYVKDKRIQYSGSLLKYSLSEAQHNKGYLVIELDQQGDINVEKKSLTPRRDLHEIRDTMANILTHPLSEDYVFVTLLDDAPVMQPMEQIRTVYPNAMHVKRDIQQSRSKTDIAELLQKPREQDDTRLFKNFLHLFNEEESDEATLQLFHNTLEKTRKEQA